MESAPSRRIDGTRNLSWKYDSHCLLIHIRNRDCSNERLRVWMELLREEIISIRVLYDLSEIHDGYSVTDLPDGAQIVRNVQV